MNNYHLSELIDLPAVQKMANANYKASGMPIGIIDAFDGSVLVGIGWQEICVKFHRTNQESLKRCQASDNHIKLHLVKGQACHYKCENGLWDIGIPIVVAERHLATLFLGQFFYEGETPDRDFFVRQAYEFDYSLDGYLAALDQVPVFKHEKVDYIIEYNKSLVNFIIDMAESSISKRTVNRALLESEQRYRRLAENSPDVIFRMSLPDGQYEYVSPASTKIFGYSPEQWYDNPFLMRNIIHPDWHSYFLEQTENLLNGQVPPTYEYRIIHKDESIRWINQRNILVKNDSGCPVAIEGFATDITERKRVEDALLESENKYRIIAENTADLISTLDMNLNFTYVSPAIMRLRGFTVEEAMKQTLEQILTPESMQLALDVFEKEMLMEISGTADPDRTRILELEEYKKDGSTIWMEVSFSYLRDKNRKSVEILSVSRDITERKQAEEALRESEEKYRTVADFTYDWEYWVSPDQRLLYCSPSCERLTGYRTDEFEKDPGLLKRIIHPDDRDQFNSHIDGIASPDHASHTLEFRIVSKSGKVRWMAHVCTSVHGHGDVFLGWRASNRDITERVRFNEEKAKLESRLQQAQKMEAIGSLAGGIAHDLNNILFPISGFSEMLLAEIPPDSHVHESIEQIYKSAQRGSDLVKQILAVSRQSNPQKLPVRIQPILKEVLKLVRATIPIQIEITSHIDPDCGRIFADPTQIHQIAMNLITNAYHAVEGNGGTIDIALKEAAKGSFSGQDDLHDISMSKDHLAGGYACLSISDTGTGIEQRLIDKIFDPYFSTKEQGKGTGLGLSVVHGIVKESGGDIRVYSEVGKGTVFHVYLPLLEDTNDKLVAEVTRKYPTGSERILLVDDEEPIVRLEQMLLEKLGYQITVCTSSPDALAVFKANPDFFDLVISDRGMPNMTGEQLARELISIRPEIPVILCTGFSDENDENRARKLGVKGFLKKPVATRDLAEMVRKVLDEVNGSAS